MFFRTQLSVGTECFAHVNDGAWHRVLLSFDEARLTLTLDESTVIGAVTMDSAIRDGPGKLMLGVRAPSEFFLTGSFSACQLHFEPLVRNPLAAP